MFRNQEKEEEIVALEIFAAIISKTLLSLVCLFVSDELDGHETRRGMIVIKKVKLFFRFSFLLLRGCARC
jgi:hypothetical protein